MSRKTLSFIIAAALLMTGGLSFADAQHQADHAKAGSHTETHAKPVGGIYPLTVDPLGDQLADVEKPIILVHNNRELRFVTEANAQAFQDEPEKYLSQLDQSLIEQQRPLYPMDKCIVSDQALGTMGEPVDYLYGNRLVRFCCKMCKGRFERDPDKYLSEIDAAVIEAQKADYPSAACVVSDDQLGGDMGEPVDYVVGTRLVRLCCKMCIEDFEANPAKYVAKLDNNDNENHQ
jgi:YHS domain-containing protein